MSIVKELQDLFNPEALSIKQGKRDSNPRERFWRP